MLVKKLLRVLESILDHKLALGGTIMEVFR